MSAIDVPVTTQLVGQEQVCAGFQRMGAASDDMSLKMQQNNRAMMTSMASLATQSLSMTNLFERMAKGQVSAGEAVVQLGAYALQAASQLTMLNIAYEKKLALQGASVLASARETAANISETASRWARTAALNAHNIAQTIAHSLSGPIGWALLGGAAVAAAGALALTASVPKMGDGGIAYRPTFALIGERGPEAVVPLDRSFSNQITVNVYGVSNYEEARRGAFDGVREALQLDQLARKTAA